MKKVILPLCFMPFMAFGQVSYNFETASLDGWVQSAAGHWAADTLSAISGRYSLHHLYDNPEAGTDQAGTRLARFRPSSGTAIWSFSVKHGADPSASNNWAVFLMSDNDPYQMFPAGNTSGYAVGVNLAGYDDTLRLWKIMNGNVTAVKAVPVNWQTDIGTLTAVKIVVERDVSGEWKISLSSLSGPFSRSTSCIDPELFSPRWFGIFYRYTSTRDRLLWIDDISIEGVFADPAVPPGITKVKTAGESLVEVFFDADISPLSAVPSNFSCEPAGNKAVNVEIESQSSMKIDFQEIFPNKASCRLIAKNICDLDSVCAENITFDFTPARAEPGDVVISEIMADPSPPVSLPAKEYLELSNTSGFAFSVNGWKLVSEGDNALFPGSVIGPGQIVIICSQSDTALFSKYGVNIGLKSFPSLTDDGKCLILTDNSGNMIHCLSYSPEWYGDELKSGGGWSLEMIDTGFPFSPEANWKASVSSSGGTPGKKNSVAGFNPDNIFKGLVNVYPADSITVVATFSETVKEPGSAAGKIVINGEQLFSAVRSELPGMEFKITTRNPLVKKKICTLSVLKGVTDHAGNAPLRKSYRFGLPEDAAVNDITFNEILFNPLPGGADYIEFYNNSDKIIDASRLFIVSVNDETADTSDITMVSDTSRCILPGTFYAITSGRDAVLARYISSADTNIFEVNKLPSMPDDNGHLILLNRQAEKIDEVRYSEKMHFQLLSGFEGISLEKVRPASSSWDPGNWHSASESSGWGTPGAVNSVYTETPGSNNSLVLSSTRITPDNDGYEDVLVIDLRLTGNANVVNILIFDEYGNVVRKLVQNLYAINSLSEVWDGSADDRSLVSRGIYVILVTVFDETGKTSRWKKVCSVIR
ncbi:MAG: lamin tail domain-containing protein [Bacteroidales bacterium]|jgi:hypothetical protein